MERGIIPADTPIERRAPYIKRIVAVPGDTLAILDKTLILNGEPQPLAGTLKQRWRAFSSDGDRPSTREMLDMGVQFLTETDGVGGDGVRQFDVTATAEGAQLLQADPEVARVEPFVLPDSITFSDPRLFDPRAIDLIYDPALAYNYDQYGPLVVPGAGMTIDVNARTMTTYADVLEQYEGVDVSEARGGGFLLNGVARETYTFTGTYYFAMGDNRGQLGRQPVLGLCAGDAPRRQGRLQVPLVQGGVPVCTPEPLFPAHPLGAARELHDRTRPRERRRRARASGGAASGQGRASGAAARAPGAREPARDGRAPRALCSIPPAPLAPEAPPATPERGGGSVFRVVALAFLAAVGLRACVFEAYRIPSSSMEQTLQPGDYVFVSKVGYGTRVPESFRVPFSRRDIANPVLPGVRLPGLGGPARGDVVVFHYPPDGGPISRRTPYVKRMTALPGETVEIREKHVFVDGERVAPVPTARQFWVVLLAERAYLHPDSLAAMGARGRVERVSDRERVIEATREVASRVRALPGVESVEALVRRPGDGSADFPASAAFSLDDWGPIRVPFEGWTIGLSSETWELYRGAILKHEPAVAARVAGGFTVDGVAADSFTFAQDYYVVLGDHRDDSADSRSWGFVPASHLVGRARLIYFSWDPETGHARWDRALHVVR